MTLTAAAARWWDERGALLKGGDRLEARIERAVALVGPARPIREITTQVVSRAIEKRRGQTRTHAKGDKPREYLPTGSTVNRDMIDTLRPILNRARKAWGATLPQIDWAEVRMDEPKPKPKEFAGDELDLVLAKVRPHWHDVIRFAATYGCRVSELWFALDDIDVNDPGAARIKLRDRKGGDDHMIPLLPADAAMIAARLGRARAAELETVWFREKRMPGPGGQVILKPLSQAGLEIAVRRAMTASGLRAAKGMRGIHATRHHAAMQILRATGNLRVAQRLLGHADIKSTMVYAHAIEDDVRAGLAALSRNSPELPTGDTENPAQDQSAKKA
ncbi:tyrosine-type recombinase/integrase [Brevundimonas sp. NIBR10]|uniref:tyrosine-type recombinase/integrase n=1 Tax=Brevundimonas sp. NIBR10 TaxID=3015997 RepID=UPI0022F1AF47|nr:tyrosine-type recombinase/integrase [Brevundimonas sp. NIBR10]